MKQRRRRRCLGRVRCSRLGDPALCRAPHHGPGAGPHLRREHAAPPSTSPPSRRPAGAAAG